MGNEASKTRDTWNSEFRQILAGKGLDIGAGADPIAPTAQVFDLQHGDAARIDEFLNDSYDYVFSSHCLEHMRDPTDALRRWWSLVRPGGHLILIVPEETLYEQGFWPSIFNDDHKATFRLVEQTWSPVSFRVQDLVAELEGVASQEITIQNHGYVEWGPPRPVFPRSVPRVRLWLFKKVRKFMASIKQYPDWRFLIRLGVPVDQTAFGALAQLQIVLRKKEIGRASCRERV